MSLMQYIEISDYDMVIFFYNPGTILYITNHYLYLMKFVSDKNSYI